MISDKVKKAFNPPPRLSVSQWADKNRVLSPEGSAEPGLWRTERAQKGILDVIGDENYETVVLMASSQVGKTEILLNALGYHIHLAPAPILFL